MTPKEWINHQKYYTRINGEIVSCGLDIDKFQNTTLGKSIRKGKKGMYLDGVCASC